MIIFGNIEVTDTSFEFLKLWVSNDKNKTIENRFGKTKVEQLNISQYIRLFEIASNVEKTLLDITRKTENIECIGY